MRLAPARATMRSKRSAGGNNGFHHQTRAFSRRFYLVITGSSLGVWPNICFIAFVWMRRFNARVAMASRRSSNARSCSNRSLVTDAADLSNKVHSAASGSSSILGRSSSADLISLGIASVHSDVDLKFDRGNFRFRRSNSSGPESTYHIGQNQSPVEDLYDGQAPRCRGLH